jgi:hypothetical protein
MTENDKGKETKPKYSYYEKAGFAKQKRPHVQISDKVTECGKRNNYIY